METQVLPTMDFEYAQYKGKLTREYNVSSDKEFRISFSDACAQLDAVPMLDTSNTLWEKIMSDIIQEQKGAWDKLSDL